MAEDLAPVVVPEGDIDLFFRVEQMAKRISRGTEQVIDFLSADNQAVLYQLMDILAQHDDEYPVLAEAHLKVIKRVYKEYLAKKVSLDEIARQRNRPKTDGRRRVHGKKSNNKL